MVDKSLKMEPKVECLLCKHPMQVVVKDHQYGECGLPYVVIQVEDRTCTFCGEHEVGIGAVEVVHQDIAWAVITHHYKKGKLGASEIRFLRTFLDLEIADLADKLGVQEFTLKRWEEGLKQWPITGTADRLLRMMVWFRIHDQDEKFPFEPGYPS